MTVVGREEQLGLSIFFSIFVFQINDNHVGNLGLVDKSLFLFWLCIAPLILSGPMYSCHSKMIILERKIQNGRYKINTIIITLSIVEIETWFSHQTIYLC